MIQADTSPSSHPSPFAQPYGLVLRLSLGLSLAGGFGLGLALLLGLALKLPLPVETPALLQAHGAIQALGLVPLFVLGVGVHLFPKFHDYPLDRPKRVSYGGLLLALGVALRAVAQPAGPATWRSAALVIGAVLVLVGSLVALEALGRVARKGQQSSRGRLLLTATAGSSLLLAVVLNGVISLTLAGGAPLAPTGLNEAFLHLALWGFGAGMILVVGGRVFETLLLLRPERPGLVRPMQVAWALGVFGVPAVWLLVPESTFLRGLAFTAQFAGAAGFVACHRLFEPPVAVGSLPAVTTPTRWWARLSFGFLLLAALLGALLSFAEALTTFSAASTAYSAVRHGLAQGFLLPVMTFMGARTLPRYSRQMLRRRRLLGGIMAALYLGAALRLGGELIGGYNPGWGLVVALGALLGTGGFTAFAIGLWRTTPSPTDTPPVRVVPTGSPRRHAGARS